MEEAQRFEAVAHEASENRPGAAAALFGSAVRSRVRTFERSTKQSVAVSEARRALESQRPSLACEAFEVLRQSLQQRQHLLHEFEESMRIARSCNSNERLWRQLLINKKRKCENYQDRLDRSEPSSNLAANAHHRQYDAKSSSTGPSTIKC